MIEMGRPSQYRYMIEPSRFFLASALEEEDALLVQEEQVV